MLLKCDKNGNKKILSSLRKESYAYRKKDIKKFLQYVRTHISKILYSAIKKKYPISF